MADGDNWVLASSLAAGFDLDLLVLALNRNNIRYRLIERDEGHELWLDKGQRLADVQQLIGQIQKMTVVAKTLDAGTAKGAASARLYFTRVPVTLITLILGVLGYFVVSYLPDFVHWLTFVDFTLANGNGPQFIPVEKTFAAAEYWRFVTPAFLHFGIFHVVFNSLWLWEFGRRVELVAGRSAYLVLMLALASGSNAGQYLWDGPVLFGGLSGVVYGLVGYVWIRNKVAPNPLLNVQPGIIYMLIGWLLICLFGIVDMFIHGGVANGAHVSGLLIGMLAGALGGRLKPAA
ncbi:MAG: rhomboid family intramembrane serine protease [Gammaproteobacteria bacterium]|nr:rhomboid family intramembrane serine protease [Gammaproteobacteria bacterium]MBQ0838635.1 rhomboid family intramembrane serine protease [Gammaproteobacteria bacterium]